MEERSSFVSYFHRWLGLLRTLHQTLVSTSIYPCCTPTLKYTQTLPSQDLLSPVNYIQLIHNCGHADNLLSLFDGSPVHWSHSFYMIISIRLCLWVSCWSWREGAAVAGWECVSVYVRQCSRCTLCVFTAERVTIINQPTLWNWTQNLYSNIFVQPSQFRTAGCPLDKYLHGKELIIKFFSWWQSMFLSDGAES
jgi:hypothetical protein